MGRFRIGVPFILLLSLAFFFNACGSSPSSSLPPPPPPPPADFALGFSTTSISVQQGATSSALTVTVNALNGFSGSAQVTLNALPSGVTTNPASPFTVAPGSGSAVLFGASATASTGTFPLSVQAVSGSLNHSYSLSLGVQSAVAAALPRTSFVRTDATSAADNPLGEPHHRHLAYDSAHKQLFLANSAMNRVEVFSTTSQSRIAQIPVPGATSADISSDSTTAWVGTSLESIVAIDTSSLRVKARYQLNGLSPLPGSVFDRPEEVLFLSSGKAMVRLRQPFSTTALLALWDPSSNTLTNLTSAAPAAFQQGVGLLARSGDHSKVLAAAADSSGELALFDSAGNVLAGPLSLGSGTISHVAANRDGSRFAVFFSGNSGPQLLLLDASLAQVAAYSFTSASGLTFSTDGTRLYLAEALSGSDVITALDGNTAALLGRSPDAAIQSVPSQLEEADETQLLFALSNRGLAFLDASAPASLPPSAPTFAAAPALQPSEGASSGGTSTVLSGQNFSALTQLHFGTQSAPSPNVSGATQMQAISPPSDTNAAVNLTAYFQDGWLALAPDAFSYGPEILQILPNAGSSSGGDSIQIYGYGFGSDPTKLGVTIGGAAAAVSKIENAPAIAASLGLDTTYPFSLERVSLQTPAGVSGKADVSISAPSGSVTLAKSFQYLQSVRSFSHPAFFRFILYDQHRQRIDVSNQFEIEVFDLGQNIFLSPVQPAGATPSFAAIRGLALTPDSSQLVVADFGNQNVYLLDPVLGTGSTVSVGGVPGFLNSGPARVAATSTQAVFVGLSGEGGSSGACSSCLLQMNLTANPPTIQPAPQREVTSITGSPLVQGAAAGDAVFVAFGSSTGGPAAVWNSSTPNQFTVSPANASASDLGASSDGTFFALQSLGIPQVRGADLSLTSVPTSAELQQIPGRLLVPGVTLHPSGSLVYQPFLTGTPGTMGVKGGVDISDAHSGQIRLRVFLPQQFMTDADGLHGSFLTIDENGQRLFAITSSDGTPQNASLSIVQLAAVPLGIGSISPSTISAAGGVSLTIRGSGFQPTTTLSINGKTVSITIKDAHTIQLTTPALAPGSQQLTITNPDGETVSLDAAFLAI